MQKDIASKLLLSTENVSMYIIFGTCTNYNNFWWKFTLPVLSKSMIHPFCIGIQSRKGSWTTYMVHYVGFFKIKIALCTHLLNRRLMYSILHCRTKTGLK